ncbi:MAG: VOC family protein [Ruminococcaceae bacterium]|nr:VOC family protein [Oscillospiraceae bacterium]
MYRSMMQVVVRGSDEALQLYKRAFDAEILCCYLNDDGTCCHAELDVYGQVVALMEQPEPVTVGNTMMFCLHMGKGCEAQIKKAYDVLKDGAEITEDIGPCSYSPCQFVLTDRFGVCWCLFV